MSAKYTIIKIPVIGRLVFLFFRFKLAMSFFWKPLGLLFKWLFISRETTNFTYDLTAENKQYLALLVAKVTGLTYQEVWAYFRELDEDVKLKEHIKRVTRESEERYFSDIEVLYAKRYGWYAIARAIKPRIIVETGIDKGLGSIVMTAALMRNKNEGYDGYFYGTDINPRAGYLFKGEYAKSGQILYGDSNESVRNLDVEIDLFISETFVSADFEVQEMQVASTKLSDQAVIIGRGYGMQRFAMNTNREFLYFREDPQDHWYMGGAITMAYKERKKQNTTQERVSVGVELQS